MPFPTSSFVRDGRFTDVRPLGRGAAGQVYYARHALLGRPVAVKEALPSNQNFVSARARFETEARVQAQLHDDQIIVVYSLEQDPQTNELYLICEYANGGSLADHLSREGPFSQEQAIQITLDVLGALETTSAQGVVHCDIKPSNVLLVRDQSGQIVRAKLGDFGVAYDRRGSAATIKPGAVHPGTPLYMAPEQSNALNPLDVRTDLYALGITLWEMLTRTDYKPLLARGRPDLRRLNPQVHPALGNVIRKAVQDDPARRYASPAEMARDLRAVPAAPRSAPRRAAGCLSPLLIGLLMLLMLGLGAGATYWLLQNLQPGLLTQVVTATPQASDPATLPTSMPPTAAATAGVAALPTTPAPTATPEPQTILQRVQARGRLLCGVNPDLPGFGFYDSVRRQWSGFDIDFCRVVAVAIFNDPAAIEFVPLSSEERWEAIRSGRVDVLFRNSTWTALRDTAEGVDFGPTTFHDGQGLMVRSASGVTTLAELAGRSVCVEQATTSLDNLRDEFNARGIAISIRELPDNNTTYAEYDAGLCDAVTSDASQLLVRRETLSNPDEHSILGELISREPLGPAFAEDDSQWRDIVSWAVFATIYAEELRVNQANVEALRESSSDPRIQRLLGIDGQIGGELGLSADFGYNIVRLVGNYADIYDRNLGPETPFALDRGPNKVWNLGAGGVLASPPFR